MIKKSVLVVVMLLMATNLWAVKTSAVSNSKHNLGSFAPAFATGYASGNEDEVCIYCHTPHGGTLDAPLWNRNMTFDGTGAGFTHYTSSSLSSYMTGVAGRAVSTESLLCLSCHDGTVAIGSLINVSNRTDAAPDNGLMMDEIFPGYGGSAVIGNTPWGPNQGRDLSDDHPISFSYYSAVEDSDNSGKFNKANGVPATDPTYKGIRLFGPAEMGGQKVECSSCHDPHVDSSVDTQYAPFLVMSNSGSALCLACHIK